jgi:hypothetical protein
MITFQHIVSQDVAHFVRIEDSFLFLDKISDPYLWKIVNYEKIINEVT